MRRLPLLMATMVLLAAALAGYRSPIEPAPSAVTRVSLHTPPSVEAGHPLRVRVEAEARDGTPVLAIVRSSYRAARTETTLAGGVAVVDFPHGTTDAAGVLDVAVLVGGTWLSTSLDVMPGPLATPPVPMVGARSVVAGDTDRALVVVIPSDALGNPVETSDVTVTARWPDGAIAAFAPQPSSTLYWVWVPARRLAGPALVTASAGAVLGPERTLRVVPGEVETLSFDVGQGPYRADGVSLLTVTTARLADAHGNEVLDGTAVAVATTTASGHRSFQTVATVGGIARALIEAPSEPGPLQITVSAGTGIAHRTVELGAALATTVPPVRLHSRAGPDLVEVGPIVGDLGQLVPDGTTVDVTVPGVGAAGVGATRAGIAVISLEVGEEESLAIDVGGRRFVVPVEVAP